MDCKNESGRAGNPQKASRLTLAGSDPQAEKISSQGLHFGVRKRSLPSVLERLCLQYLSLGDLTALFLVSRSISSGVREFLSTLKALLCFTDEDDQQALFGMQLVVRFCRSLTHVEIPQDWCSMRDERMCAHINRFLLLTIRHNRSSLRAVRPGAIWPQEALAELVRCPMLEMLEFHDLRRARLEGIAQRLTVERLPHLTSLSCSSYRDSTWLGEPFGFSAQELKRILKSELPLQSLRLCSINAGLLSCLALPNYSALHTLEAELSSGGIGDLREFGEALAKRPSLTSLTVSFPHDLPLDSIAWSLPNVCSLELRAVTAHIPTIRAPSLTTLTVSVDAVDFDRLFDLACASALNKLLLLVNFSVDDIKLGVQPKAVTRLISTLRAGAWPTLIELALRIQPTQVGCDGLVSAIAAVRRPLQQLRLMIPEAADLADVKTLLSWPDIEDATFDLAFHPNHLQTPASCAPFIVPSKLHTLEPDPVVDSLFASFIFVNLTDLTLRHTKSLSSIDVVLQTCGRLLKLSLPFEPNLMPSLPFAPQRPFPSLRTLCFNPAGHSPPTTAGHNCEFQLRSFLALFPNLTQLSMFTFPTSKWPDTVIELAKAGRLSCLTNLHVYAGDLDLSTMEALLLAMPALRVFDPPITTSIIQREILATRVYSQLKPGKQPPRIARHRWS